MELPCACKPAFIVAGLAFLKPELTSIQFQNLTMVATALILGSKFSLTQISLMWLREKSDTPADRSCHGVMMEELEAPMPVRLPFGSSLTASFG